MNIYGANLPVYIIKIFSKENYREDFINGKLYLNESGYFNKLDDFFRGDKYDSKIVECRPTIFINNHKFQPDIMIQGFVGDNKVPILCATILNEDCFYKSEDNFIRLKKEVATELAKFGKYGLMFTYYELKKNIDKASEENNIVVDQDIVKYVNFHDINREYLKIYRGDRYKKYFVKEVSYKNQNEVRFIFLSNRKDKFVPLINDNEDHYILQASKLSWYVKFDMSDELDLKIFIK